MTICERIPLVADIGKQLELFASEKVCRPLKRFADEVDTWAKQETVYTHSDAWLTLATGCLVGAACIAEYNGFKIDPAKIILDLIQKSKTIGSVRWEPSATEWFWADTQLAGRDVEITSWSRNFFEIGADTFAKALTGGGFHDKAGNHVPLLSQLTLGKVNEHLSELGKLEDIRNKLAGLFQLAAGCSVMYALLLEKKDEKLINSTTILPGFAKALRGIATWYEKPGGVAAIK